jgi:hypothetical protein
MPKYHFPIVDGVTLPDPVGIDLKNGEQAKSHAKSIAKHLAMVDLKHERNVVVVEIELRSVR